MRKHKTLLFAVALAVIFLAFSSCIRSAQPIPAVSPAPTPLPSPVVPPPPSSPITSAPSTQLPLSKEVFEVEFTNSKYAIASGQTSGFFKTGQAADILLSGIDFDNTGGSLLFNHPAGLASDGKRLFLADTFNNRVLVWNTIPQGNVPPDLVLGQKDFTSNSPGREPDQMNWPINVATDGKRLLVADVFNDRILVWNSIPLTSGSPADLALQGSNKNRPATSSSRDFFIGPWGIWTDGERLAVSNTWGGGSVLIWNRFPTESNQPADIILKAGGEMGTPRHITSDGKSLIVGDHNARVKGQPEHGSFFWKTFPTVDDQTYDFYMSKGGWLRGTFTEDGKLFLLGDRLFIWNSFMKSAADPPVLTVRPDIREFQAGGYESMVIVDGKLFLSLGNGNRIVVYNSIPTSPTQPPDFAIGSPDIQTNTLSSHFFIQNGTVASNGKSLFISSDFDRKLYVWKSLPDESGAHPDIVYSIARDSQFAPWDIVLWKNTLALAGKTVAVVWKKPPLNGEQPDIVFNGGIGNIRFRELSGVALDDRYFYLADSAANKLYVWEGLPAQDSDPKFQLDIEGPFGGLDSDGRYLVVARSFHHTAEIYRVEELGPNARPGIVGGRGRFNGVPGAAVAYGRLFISDGFNRVSVWQSVEEAMSGKWPPDVILGENDLDDTVPEIGRNKLFWPRSLSFDGKYLWVGEVKFSDRILRFSPSP